MKDVQKQQYNARYKSSYFRPQTPPAGNSSPWSAHSDEEAQSSHSGFIDGYRTGLGGFDDNCIDNSMNLDEVNEIFSFNDNFEELYHDE
jgi:hypothetical protein